MNIIMKFFFVCFMYLFFCMTLCQAQNRKEFTFENGKTAYFVKGNDDYWGVEDSEGKIIVPYRYKKLSQRGNVVFCQEAKGIEKKYASALYDSEGKNIFSEIDGFGTLDWSIINGEKRIMGRRNLPWSKQVIFGKIYSLPQTVDGDEFVWDYDGNLLYHYSNKKDGLGFTYLLNKKSDTVVVAPGKYTGVIGASQGFLRVNRGRKKGILSLDGKVIIEADKYGSIGTNGNKGFWVYYSQNMKGPVGYHDINGKCIIPISTYKHIYPMKDGTFAVEGEGKAGIAYSDGKIKFMTDYQAISLHYDKLGKPYYMIFNGDEKAKLSYEGEIIEDSIMTITKKTQHTHIINQEQKSSDGFVWIERLYSNGKHDILDSLGNQIIEPDYDFISYNSHKKGFRLESGIYEGFALMDGKIVIPTDQYESVYTSSSYGKYFLVSVGGREGILDENGKVVISPKWDNIKLVDDSLFEVEKGIYHGIINKEEETIVPLEYTYIRKTGNTFIVEQFSKKGYLDMNGNIIIPLKERKRITPVM